MIRTFTAALLALLIQPGGTSSPPTESQPANAPPAGETRQCIDMSSIVSRQAEDERTIRFELLGGRVYRNQLQGACPGLRQAVNGFGTLAFDVQGSSICRGDRIRVINSSEGLGRGYANAIPCPLGDFVAVSRPDTTEHH